MFYPDLPSGKQRLLAAEVSGEVQRLAFGPDSPVPVERCVAHLHQITTDPVVLGNTLGTYLAYADRSQAYLPAVEMLRAAGADEEHARLKATWLRQEIAEGRHLF